MKCSLLTLSCALDGELSRERQSELEAHLVTCERCRTGMRYLREETDRISQLARVAVSGSTATALLERARVLAAPEPAAEAAPGDIPPAEEAPGAADPFSLMGIGTQLIPTDAPGADAAEDLGEGSVTEVPDQPADTATGTFPSDLEVSSQLPAPSDQPAPTAMAPAGQSEPASEADSGGSSPDEDAADVADGLGRAEPPDAAAEDMAEPENPSQGEEQPPLEDADSGGGSLAEENPVAGVWQVDREALGAAADTSVFAPGEPRSEPISNQDAPLVQEPADKLDEPPVREWGQGDPWLGSGSAATPPGSLEGEGPPPLFMPFRQESFEATRPDPGEASWPSVQGPSSQPDPQLESEPASDSGPSSEPAPTTRQSDEVMQVALEESALLGELSALDHLPPGDLPSMPREIDAPSIPPPPSVGGGTGSADRGWEPSTSLNLGLGDVAAAEPTIDLTGIGRQPPSEMPPPAGSDTNGPAGGFRPINRPSESVAAVTGSSASFRSESVRRSVAAPKSRRQPPPGPRQSAPPRSWTKAATIAIAALAVFLIGWSLLHHTSKPASTTPTHHHATTQQKPKPTPTVQATAPAQAAVTLTGTRTFGGAGSGYQVQNLRYGLHQNNTQLWVVFQLMQGTGPPKVTVGFDGQTSLYVEMAGVAAGTTVAQPTPGGLITSVTPTQISGFSGAVYLLKLSRATTVQTAYLLAGSPTGSAGERVVLQLQN